MSAFRSDRRFSQRLARSPELREALGRVGRAVAAEAERLSAPEHSIEVIERGRGVRVVNTSPDAIREEWGSAREEPRAPLRRAARATGLRLDETR